MSSETFTRGVFDSPGFFADAFGQNENYNLFEASFREGNAANNRAKEILEANDRRQSSVQSDDIDPMLRAGERPGKTSTRVQPSSLKTNTGHDPRANQFPTPTTSRSPPSSKSTSRHNDDQMFLQSGDAVPNTTVAVDPWDLGNSYDSPLQDLMLETNDISGGTLDLQGQMTPPDSAVLEGDFHDSTLPPTDHLHSVGMDEAPKKKRGRKPKAQTAGAAANPGPRPKGRPSKGKGRDQDVKEEFLFDDMSVDGSNEMPEKDEKRQKFLARNRVAASKCRDRKKHREERLKSDVQELQNERNLLGMMVGDLKEQALYLKGELLKHSTCDCERIRQYLDLEVTNISAQAEQGLLGSLNPTTKRRRQILSSGGSPSMGSNSSAALLADNGDKVPDANKGFDDSLMEDYPTELPN
ncbi:MAG: hypothetical protein M1825_001973 [Sarcosagium campestre]|nr:MAG: hypothetical protein M1825_001973 [Sarcosagium campestre]